jgi:hypothetical protein
VSKKESKAPVLNIGSNPVLSISSKEINYFPRTLVIFCLGLDEKSVPDAMDNTDQWVQGLSAGRAVDVGQHHRFLHP